MAGKLANSMKGMLSVMKLMNKLGVFALKPSLIPIGDGGKLSAELLTEMRVVLATSDSHAETMIAETQYAAVPQAVPTLGDLPLTVISHGKLDANAIPPNLGQVVRDDYERAWQKLQVEITSLSTRGRRIVAERSGHNIIYDQPEIIIQTILEMVEATRQSELYQREVVLVD
jgi:hypothetical protein